MDGTEATTSLPLKLIERDGVLGYLVTKRDGSSTFEKKTNFSLQVLAHVKGKTSNGAMLKVNMEGGNDSWTCFASMADMSRTDKMMHQLNKSCANGLWTSGFLDPDFPAYINDLVASYIEGDEVKRVYPVKHVGRQDDGVWVLNEHVQLNSSGTKIPRDNWHYWVVPGLFDIPGDMWCDVIDLDEGQALTSLLNAAKNLLGSNFIPTVMVVASCVLSLHYQQLIKCTTDHAVPISVAVGEPDCGKSTALKCGLYLLGHTGRLDNDITYAALLRAQSKTTMGVAYDDPEKWDDIKNVVTSTYSMGGKKTMHGKDIPLCTPIVTTNQRIKGKRILSRVALIPFPTPMPRLSGMERLQAERELRNTLQNAPKSLGVLVGMGEMFDNDKFLDQVYAEYMVEMEEYVSSKESRMLKNYGLLIFMTNELLERAGFINHKVQIWHYIREVVIPFLKKECVADGSETHVPKPVFNGKEVLSVLLRICTGMKKEESDTVLNSTFVPTGCACGDCVVFRTERAAEVLQQRYPGLHKQTIEMELKGIFLCFRSKAKFFDKETDTYRPMRAIHIPKTYLKQDAVLAIETAHRDNRNNMHKVNDTMKETGQGDEENQPGTSQQGKKGSRLDQAEKKDSKSNKAENTQQGKKGSRLDQAEKKDSKSNKAENTQQGKKGSRLDKAEKKDSKSNKAENTQQEKGSCSDKAEKKDSKSDTAENAQQEKGSCSDKAEKKDSKSDTAENAQQEKGSCSDKAEKKDSKSDTAENAQNRKRKHSRSAVTIDDQPQGGAKEKTGEESTCATADVRISKRILKRNKTKVDK